MSRIPHVFVASIATETNTFSPLRTDLQDFKDSFYAAPGEHPETPTLCSAVFNVARAQKAANAVTLTEGTATWAEPGGVVSQQTWEFLRDQLLAELKAAGPVDIVLLGLHGAMIAQDCRDCEGELLEAVRKLVGEDVIIGATFDPHSHMSERRYQNGNLLLAFKEFPHTDFVDCAENLMNLSLDAFHGKVKPELSVFDCLMIDIFATSREPMRGFVDRVKNMEAEDPRILSVSIIHGFMAGDTEALGTKVVVISDNDKEYGDEVAKRLGMELFQLRGTTRPAFLPIDEALDLVEADKSAPKVLADVWDNPGGGVAGDSTLVLQEVLRRKLKNVAVATIWDPMAVRICKSAGVGAVLPLRFGGKTSFHAGQPIDAVVKVLTVVPNAVQEFGQSVVPLGDSVTIQIDDVKIILNTVRSQVFSPTVFSNLGIDPKSCDLLVVKSTNHFHSAFEPIASSITYTAVEGPYPNDPATNNYQYVSRKIWPMIANPHEAALARENG